LGRLDGTGCVIPRRTLDEIDPCRARGHRLAGDPCDAYRQVDQMTNQEPYIDLRSDDPEWIQQQLERRAGDPRVVLRPIEDDLDSEGHAVSTTLRVQAFGDEDDTEGHAISIQFPSREDAAAFRRRLVLTGALTGTLVLGAAGGFGLANVVDGAVGGGGTTVSGAQGDGVTVGPDSPARGTIPVPE
jgi:hypothetical protein